MPHILTEQKEITGITLCPHHSTENMLKGSDPELVSSYHIADFTYCPIPECGHVAFIVPDGLSGVDARVARQAVQIAALGRKIAAARRGH